jgi:hypothetical protein
MSDASPRETDRQDRSNLLAGAVVLILLLAGAVGGIWVLTGRFGKKDRAVYSVYVAGVPQLGGGTEVLYLGQHIGEVMHADPPAPGLQLLATANVVPEVTEVITLRPGERIAVRSPTEAEPVQIALESLTRVLIRSQAGEHVLVREAANRWIVDGTGSRERLVVNGAEIGARGVPAVVRTGDVLALGGLRIEWQDVGDLSRVRVQIALKKLRKVAGVADSLPAAYLLGPRSSLAIVSAFGLGAPALRLEPGFGRETFVMSSDSVIALAPALDLERTVQGMLTYLNSPAALRREPATRFERVVSDLNRTLDQVAALGAQLDEFTARMNAVSRQDGGQGMVGRLVLAPATRDSLGVAASRLATLAAPLADTTKSLLARLKLDSLDAGLARTVASADRVLGGIDSAVGKAGGFIDTLAPAIGIVRDSVAPLLGRGSGLVVQGTATAKGINRWLPPFLISGAAVAVTGVLKLLGVF